MKQLFFLFALITIAFSQNSFGQDSIKSSSSKLLIAYYQLKDNLVKSNSTNAAGCAAEMVNVINTADKEFVNDVAKVKLLTDANAIAQSKDLKEQRISFASLSNTMLDLAKSSKLSGDPIYQQYCPMKKASWLSSDKAIKNPYYGSAMLTCGSIKTTL